MNANECEFQECGGRANMLRNVISPTTLVQPFPGWEESILPLTQGRSLRGRPWAALHNAFSVRIPCDRNSQFDDQAGAALRKIRRRRYAAKPRVGRRRRTTLGGGPSSARVNPERVREPQWIQAQSTIVANGEAMKGGTIER
jgi:hypothetical protein